MGDGDRPDVLDHIGAPGDPSTDSNIRNRRILYRASSAVLALILAVAVVGATDLADTYGVASTWVSADERGYELDVRYATVSRPGLATAFELVVRRPDGFDTPITIAVDHDYLRLWDVNGSSPSPSSETTRDGWVLWQFEPPEGEVLHVTYDARIEPAVQRGETGRVAVLDGDELVAGVEFTTRVLP